MPDAAIRTHFRMRQISRRSQKFENVSSHLGTVRIIDHDYHSFISEKQA